MGDETPGLGVETLLYFSSRISRASEGENSEKGTSHREGIVHRSTLIRVDRFDRPFRLLPPRQVLWISPMWSDFCSQH